MESFCLGTRHARTQGWDGLSNCWCEWARIYAHAKYLCSREINVAALRIGADQFDAKLVSHIHTVTLDKQAFHMRLEYPHKSSLGRGSRHDGVKYLANAASWLPSRWRQISGQCGCS